jgi:tetratricopeptide (TPR) repeat protein
VVKTTGTTFAGSLVLPVALLFSSCETTQKGSVVSHDTSPVSEQVSTSSVQIAARANSGDELSGVGDLGVLGKEQVEFSKALAHYVSGLIHRSNEKYTEALEDWEKTVQLDPERRELRDLVLQEYLRRGEHKKVISILEPELKRRPKSFPYWTLLAISYRTDKQLEKAEMAAEKAIQLDPNKLPAYQVLFESAIEAQDLKQARKVLDRAARQNSTEYQFWIQLAELYTALGGRDASLALQKEKVIAFYEKAIKLEPEDTSVLLTVADYYSINQHLPAAIDLYKRVLEKQPNAESVRIKLAITQVLNGDRASALATLKQVVEKEPLRFQVFTLMGELLEEQKDFDGAMANYRLSLSANNNQLTPHLKIVLLELRRKNLQSALSELNAAREKFPTTAQVSYFYGLVHSELKEYDKAVKYFEESEAMAKVSNPELLDGAFYYYYAAGLERNGEFDRAVQLFQKVMELNPDYSDAYNYVGYMYAEKNLKLDEALQLVEKALAYEPDNGAYLDSLGWIYYRMGRFKEALEQLQKAAEAIKDDSVIFEHLGDVYEKLGDTANAAKHYQRALELDAQNKTIAGKLETLKQSLSKQNVEPRHSAPASTSSKEAKEAGKVKH